MLYHRSQASHVHLHDAITTQWRIMHDSDSAGGAATRRVAWFPQFDPQALIPHRVHPASILHCPSITVQLIFTTSHGGILPQRHCRPSCMTVVSCGLCILAYRSP